MRSVDIAAAALEPVGPKATATEGDPHDACLVAYEEGGVETGVWECTPGTFTSRWDGIVETFHVTAGAGTLTDGDGVAHPLRPGAVITIPPGSTGTWRITETLRKSYVVVTFGGGSA
jgi:uncharacterized protein